MNREEKLVRKFLIGKTRITLDVCHRLLSDHGYELRKGSGSHRTYHKKGVPPITIVTPKGTKYLKSIYIELIIKYLKLEDKK